MTTSWMLGAVPLLTSATPAYAATGSNGVVEAGPIALLGVVAAIAWHFVAARWQKGHTGRHVFIRVMPAHALAPVLTRLHLDREHLQLLRRRARRLYRRD